MTTYPLWKSFYYESAEDSIEYRVLFDGVSEIFRGKAYRSPKTGLSRIRLNDICASFLDSVLDHAELRRAENIDTLVPMNAYAEFTLEVWSERNSRWDTVKEWAVVNDTSWEERYTGEGTYSEPINGHAAPNQMVAFSYLVTASEPESICYNGTSIYFTITKGGAEETSDSGGTWEIDYETNLENAYYEMAPVNRMGARRTGYTSGGSIEFELPENEDVFQTEYEAVFWSEPDGFVLGRAVAYVGAGEDSGFKYYLQIYDLPAYIQHAGGDTTFYFRTNCFGQSRYELSSSETQGSGYEVCASGTSDSLSSITVNIAANPDYYNERYYKMQIWASDELAPDVWVATDTAYVTQQEKIHYFNFTTPDGQEIEYSDTAMTVGWETDYTLVRWEFLMDGTLVSSGSTQTAYGEGGETFTFPANTLEEDRDFVLVVSGENRYGEYVEVGRLGWIQKAIYYLRYTSTPTSISNAQQNVPFGWETNCDGRVKYVLYSGSTQGAASDFVGSGTTSSLTGDSIAFPANSEYAPKYFRMDLYASNAADLNDYVISATTSFYQEEKVHYFYFITPGGQYVPSSDETNTITWDTDWDEIVWVLTSGDTAFVQSGRTSAHTATVTIGENESGLERDYYFSAYTTGGTLIDTLLFHQLGKGYEEMYLTFHISSGGTIRWWDFAQNTHHYEYSKNGGEWVSEYGNYRDGITINVDAGDYVRFRSSTIKTETFSGSTAVFDVFGNAGSLVDKDNFQNITTAPDFNLLFKGTNVVSARNLILPGEFNFSGNPGEIGNESSYHGMFTDCAMLVDAPALPATVLSEQCYYEMFKNCTSLESAPALPATDLAEGCYASMFQGCSSLTSAPLLPATTVTRSCYERMFQSCTSLESAPALPATAVTKNCYRFMFKDCTSLESAPDLLAQDLPDGCYAYMFSGCTSLRYVKCTATQMVYSGRYTEGSTTAWLDNTSPTGTFVKDPTMYYNPDDYLNSDWKTGGWGIPEGWTVENA